MMQTVQQECPRQSGAPRLVRRFVVVVVGTILAGAGYLIAVRGEAIVVDLATLGAGVWCF